MTDLLQFARRWVYLWDNFLNEELIELPKRGITRLCTGAFVIMSNLPNCPDQGSDQPLLQPADLKGLVSNTVTHTVSYTFFKCWQPDRHRIRLCIPDLYSFRLHFCLPHTPFSLCDLLSNLSTARKHCFWGDIYSSHKLMKCSHSTLILLGCCTFHILYSGVLSPWPWISLAPESWLTHPGVLNPHQAWQVCTCLMNLKNTSVAYLLVTKLAN